jgi:hypothetical protein
VRVSYILSLLKASNLLPIQRDRNDLSGMPKIGQIYPSENSNSADIERYRYKNFKEFGRAKLVVE